MHPLVCLGQNVLEKLLILHHLAFSFQLEFSKNTLIPMPNFIFPGILMKWILPDVLIDFK